MEISKRQWVFIVLIVLMLVGVGGFWPFVFASILSFGPAYLYLKSIRNSEKKDKEPWSVVQTAFIWGAVSGVFYALLLNSLGGTLVYVFSGNNEDLAFVFTVVLIAPIVEEFVKPLVMFRNSSVRGEIDEIEDGIVYGAACGLGFGATENILYGLSEGYVSSGLLGVLIVVTLRTVSSILLHLTATSFTGHGISRYLVNKESFSVVVKYYIFAVFIHAAWNAAAISGSPLLLVFSILLAIGGLEFSKRSIRNLDMEASNILPNEIRAVQEDKSDWWGASNSKWDQKNIDRNSGVTAPVLNTPSQSPPEQWASQMDWKSTIGTIVFLIFLGLNLFGKF